MIPGFNKDGLLPKGIHEASWIEFYERFEGNIKRKRLLAKIKEVAIILKSVGCINFYIDGSFVTNRQRPGDFDACWDKEGVDLKKLNKDAPLLRHAPNAFLGEHCKSVYNGDVFSVDRLVADPESEERPPETISFLEFFQIDNRLNP